MPLPKIIPALADLTQDIAGAVPVELLRDWATGAQDLSTAESLLSPFQVKGTVVASDASGLSKLTQEMDLLDVLSLVSQPKEILHALGREIGGRAIGTWVADNTEMYYPAETELETVLNAMAEVQFRIQDRLRLRIGICIQSGTYFDIGGGFYGEDADEVEYLAEICAGPEEILLTENVVKQLKSLDSGSLALKKVSFEDSQMSAYLVQSKRRMPSLQERELLYPHPFPQDFYRLLPHFIEPGEVAELKRRIYAQWLRERAVVFFARQRQLRESPPLPGLLDDLVVNALMDTVIRETTSAADHIASSGGGIAILTFPTSQEALEFARAVHGKLMENGLPVQVGIDAGPILLFQNSKGPSGIAGNPVNVASKLAEDVGRPGCISITDRASQHLGNRSEYERFEISVSRITLKGIILT